MDLDSNNTYRLKKGFVGFQDLVLRNRLLGCGVLGLGFIYCCYVGLCLFFLFSILSMFAVFFHTVKPLLPSYY